jgi:hypothetical protein
VQVGQAALQVRLEQPDQVRRVQRGRLERRVRLGLVAARQERRVRLALVALRERQEQLVPAQLEPQALMEQPGPRVRLDLLERQV